MAIGDNRTTRRPDADGSLLPPTNLVGRAGKKRAREARAKKPAALSVAVNFKRGDRICFQTLRA